MLRYRKYQSSLHIKIPRHQIPERATVSRTSKTGIPQPTSPAFPRVITFPLSTKCNNRSNNDNTADSSTQLSASYDHTSSFIGWLFAVAFKCKKVWSGRWRRLVSFYGSNSSVLSGFSAGGPQDVVVNRVIVVSNGTDSSDPTRRVMQIEH